MNRTENYKLCLWHESDRILMSDFNEDHQKIESALTALANRIAALESAAAAAASEENTVNQ